MKVRAGVFPANPLHCKSFNNTASTSGLSFVYIDDKYSLVEEGQQNLYSVVECSLNSKMMSFK